MSEHIVDILSYVGIAIVHSVWFKLLPVVQSDLAVARMARTRRRPRSSSSSKELWLLKAWSHAFSYPDSDPKPWGEE